VTTTAQPSAGGAAPAEAGQHPLVETRNLTRHFKVGGNFSRKSLHAVDSANIVVNRKEIVALVGESGSGKSTIARLLARVYKPTSGEIYYQGRPLSSLRSRKDMLAYRSDVPMVFQDPFSSLNPAYRVSHGIMRGLKLHRPEFDADQRRAEAERVVEAVGLHPAGEILDRYPHELSGGQRQRIGFAQALAYKPKLILADEPVSMLDVSIRIGLLNVMAKLRAEVNVSILYITHDIATARYLSDRILVMYAGQVVEAGPTRTVFDTPEHPYTRGLLDAFPSIRGPRVALTGIPGSPPDLGNPPPGCRFQPRCPYRFEPCPTVQPELYHVGRAQARCLLHDPAYAPLAARGDAARVAPAEAEEVSS